MSLLRMVQFAAPILGLLVYVASFASEDWILTDSRYCWGLLTKCEPVGNLTMNTVLCEYMSPGESDAYFEAARAMACLGVVLYLFLQFHFSLIQFELCYHNLPAIIGLLLTCLIAIVLMLIGINYKEDSHWKDKEPSLGWSFWACLSATVCALLATIALFFRGHQVHANSGANEHGGSKHTQVHPAKPSITGSSTANNEADHMVQGENQETQSDPAYPKRNWKRKLSPILERGDRTTDRPSSDQTRNFQPSTAEVAMT